MLQIAMRDGIGDRGAGGALDWTADHDIGRLANAKNADVEAVGARGVAGGNGDGFGRRDIDRADKNRAGAACRAE